VADLMTVEVDVSRVLDAFRKLGPSAKNACLAACFHTATAVKAGAQAAIPKRRPLTYQNIVFESRRVGDGYVVMMDRTRPEPVTTASGKSSRGGRGGGMKHVGSWLEFGTRTQRPKPFLFPSAQAQEGPHLQRIAAALDRAVQEAGV
jgi:hypothetical protein